MWSELMFPAFPALQVRKAVVNFILGRLDMVADTTESQPGPSLAWTRSAVDRFVSVREKPVSLIVPNRVRAVRRASTLQNLESAAGILPPNLEPYVLNANHVRVGRTNMLVFLSGQGK